MPDPFRKVEPGDELSIGATAWNAMLGAGKEFQRRQADRLADSIATGRSATIINVKNETESDLPRNSVLGLGDPIFTPDDSTLDAFLREVTFRGAVPDKNKHKRKYVVTLEPAPAGRIVRAYIAGVCPALVDQQDEAHEYANIVDTVTDHLKSSCHGHARILWREGLQSYGYGYYDSGVQWAIVMLGVTGSCEAIGTSGGITARSGSTFGTGSVNLARSEGGEADGPIETVDVLNAGTAISSGKYCAVAWDADDTAWVAPLECES